MSIPKTVSILLGPLAGVCVFLLPWNGLDSKAHVLSGIFAWVVVWWINQAIPLGATSLVGASLMVLFGVCNMQSAFAPFAHPIVFLFFGGFILAKAMSVHGLDKRFALFLLTRSWIKGSPFRSIVALLGASSLLSMWISNTATAAMMLPVVIGIVAALFKETHNSQGSIFIAVGYACSIGGLATPVGSPPNIVALGMLESLAGIQISFFEWMYYSVPVVVLCLGVLVLLVYQKLPKREESKDFTFLESERLDLGVISRGEWNVIFAASLAVFFWVMPGVFSIYFGKTHGLVVWFKNHLPPANVSILVACLLFVLRTQKHPTLSWQQATQIDWGALLLFGGGLSLGSQMFETGLATSMASIFESMGSDVSIWWLVSGLVYFTIFFTEVSSNTASANMLIPLVIAICQQMNLSPLLPCLGVAISCSLAFMMPVATPPNAIMFGSGRVQMGELIRLGFVMNLVCGSVVIISLFVLNHLRNF